MRTGIPGGPGGHRPRPFGAMCLGMLFGLAWAAGFRAYMAELAGADSEVQWVGTFAGALLPGAVIGGLLGWAEHNRRTGGLRGWRWLALSPLAFAVAPLSLPGGFQLLLTTGMGGGAVLVVLIAMGLGYSVSGRSPRWLRLASGVVSAGLLIALAFAAPAVGGNRLFLTEPRGAWVGVLLVTFVTIFGLAASIPLRPVKQPRDQHLG